MLQTAMWISLTKFIKEHWTKIALAILAIALFWSIQSCVQAKRAHKQELDLIELNNEARYDSIQAVFTSQDSFWREKTIQMSTANYMLTEQFKTLSAKEQEWIKTADNYKKLLATAQAKIQSQATIIDSLSYEEPVIITDSNITFPMNYTLNLADSIGKATITQSIRFTHSGLQRQLSYSYTPTIELYLSRQQDNSVVADWRLDDPFATITSGQSFLPPPEPKFFEKNPWLRRLLLGLSHGAALSSGVWIGSKL